MPTPPATRPRKCAAKTSGHRHALAPGAPLSQFIVGDGHRPLPPSVSARGDRGFPAAVGTPRQPPSAGAWQHCSRQGQP